MSRSTQMESRRRHQTRSHSQARQRVRRSMCLNVPGYLDFDSSLVHSLPRLIKYCFAHFKNDHGSKHILY